MSITDADLALACLFCEDMYQPPGIQNAAWDARLLKAWNMRGYIIATDAVFVPGTRIALAAQRVFYGVLVESKTLAGTFAAVVRGTDGALEWFKDAEFLSRPHPLGGRVEDGFWSIYQSAAFRGVGQKTDAPLLSSLSSIIKNGRCYVVGHSLGGAIATYLALDLAEYLLAGRVALRAFASPHPGDQVFATVFAAHVSDYRSYAYEKDVVPVVPFLDGYAPLFGRTMLSASSIVRDGPWCNHHALSYARLLGGPDVVAAAVGVRRDLQYVDCLCSTSTAATTAAS